LRVRRRQGRPNWPARGQVIDICRHILVFSRYSSS
jgi:hypothetical protein